MDLRKARASGLASYYHPDLLPLDSVRKMSGIAFS
jgi:hypothetical protein